MLTVGRRGGGSRGTLEGVGLPPEGLELAQVGEGRLQEGPLPEGDRAKLVVLPCCNNRNNNAVRNQVAAPAFLHLPVLFFIKTSRNPVQEPRMKRTFLKKFRTEK